MKVIFIVLFVMGVLQSHSQVKDSTKITVYDPFNANETIDSQKDVVYEKNIVKWNMGMLLRGAFEMDYERCLSEKFTIEVGAGVTYMDFLYSVISDIDNYTREGVTSKYGYLLMGDIKFYPQDVLGFDGLYISVPIRYRTYYSDRQITYSIYDQTTGMTNSYSNVFKNNHEHLEYGFIVGRQTGNDWDITWDTYFGVGISSVNSNKPLDDNNGIPQQISEHRSKPFIFIGFKLGLPF
jgi:hypothetical protein